MKNTRFGRFIKALVNLWNYQGMCVRCVHLSISIIVLSVNELPAQNQIAVGLFERGSTQHFLVSPKQGTYVLLNEIQDTVYRFKSDDALSVQLIREGIQVRSIYGFTDTLSGLWVKGSGISPIFKLKIGENEVANEFANDLNVNWAASKLHLINHVDIEKYTVRVVQGEVGYGAEPEFYKIQSIICRTYVYNNLNRHKSDGFNVCDHEHCQVYNGTRFATDVVVKAAAASRGLVMVDKNNELVLAAFHANCGGETANSEDVWKEKRSYLSSVVDTFCTAQRSAIWEKVIPKTEFLGQLGFDIDNKDLDGFAFRQIDRAAMFKIGNDSISVNRMRRLLHLRSTFFDVSFDEGNFILNGRGYGHGVGLCQQGAMQMAEHGYNHSQILGYFYKGTGLVPYTDLMLEE